MKILKFILVSLLCNVVFNGLLNAQLIPQPDTEDEVFEDEWWPTCIPPKHSPPLQTEFYMDSCLRYSTTQLVIDLVTAYEVDDVIYLDVIYNEESFEIFEHYELQILKSMCGGLPTIKSNIFTCPIGWIELPHPPFEEGEKCISVPKFRVMFRCNGKEYFSNEFNFEEVLCLGESRKKINDNSITISPQPASGFINIESNSHIKHVYIHNLSGKTIKKIDEKSSGKIDLQNLTGGLYIAKILTEDGITHHKKILIQN